MVGYGGSEREDGRGEALVARADQSTRSAAKDNESRPM